MREQARNLWFVCYHNDTRQALLDCVGNCRLTQIEKKTVTRLVQLRYTVDLRQRKRKASTLLGGPYTRFHDQLKELSHTKTRAHRDQHEKKVSYTPQISLSDNSEKGFVVPVSYSLFLQAFVPCAMTRLDGLRRRARLLWRQILGGGVW